MTTAPEALSAEIRSLYDELLQALKTDEVGCEAESSGRPDGDDREEYWKGQCSEFLRDIKKATAKHSKAAARLKPLSVWEFEGSDLLNGKATSCSEKYASILTLPILNVLKCEPDTDPADHDELPGWSSSGRSDSGESAQTELQRQSLGASSTAFYLAKALLHHHETVRRSFFSIENALKNPIVNRLCELNKDGYYYVYPEGFRLGKAFTTSKEPSTKGRYSLSGILILELFADGVD